MKQIDKARDKEDNTRETRRDPTGEPEEPKVRHHMLPVDFRDIVSQRITGRKRKLFSLPMSDQLLAKYDFFELCPLDGGGGLLHYQMFGTISDRELTEQILERNRLSDWGSLPELDFGTFERWRTIEKSCWINRFYFVASLGRMYWLSKDEKIARTLKETILHFIRKHRPPRGNRAIGEHIRHVFSIRDNLYNKRTHEENEKDETDTQYVWFDFQPASRIIHLLYFVHFLKDSKSVSESEWVEIVTSLYEHAELITIGEREFTKLEPGNHQSLRGLALLFAGAFFRPFGHGEEFLDQGIRICNFHIENEFLADGTLYENSPSYHVFVTWHVRDAYLLSRSHNFGLRSDTRSRLRKAIDFVDAICEPEGRSSVINDGYAVNLKPFLESSPAEVRSCERNSKTPAFFQNAGMGIYRDRKRFLLFDASPYTGAFSHYHAGKNAFTYWYNGRPFFVDSGCCSYDDPLFAEWYKQGKAHSSLLVNGTADGVVQGTYDWTSYGLPECRGWVESNGGYMISSELESNSPGWENVSWQREIEVSADDGLIISDQVEVTQSTEIEFVFNLHPDVEVSFEGQNLVLDNGGVKVSVVPEASSKIGISTVSGRCFIDFEHRETRRILMEARVDRAFAMKVKCREPLPL